MTATHHLIVGLLDRLFDKDAKQLEKRKEALVEENSAMGGSKDGYLFQGKFWSTLPPKMQAQAIKGRLQPALKGEARQLQRDFEMMEKERTRLQHGLNLVLRPCETNQDVRDALPDEVAPFITEIATLPRTRPEAWTLQGNALHAHQYQDTAELLSFYAVNQMLY